MAAVGSATIATAPFEGELQPHQQQQQQHVARRHGTGRTRPRLHRRADRRQATHHLSPPLETAAPVHRWQRERRAATQLRRQQELPAVAVRAIVTVNSAALSARARDLSVDAHAPTALLDGELAELKRYVATSEADSERYYKAADTNRCRHRWTTLVLLFLNGITAGGSTLYNLFNTSNADGALPYRLTLNVLLVIVVAIQVWQQAFQPDQKQMNYEMTGDDYFNFAREWRLRIVQGVDDRRDKCVVALADARHTLQEIGLFAMPLRASPAPVRASLQPA